MLDNNHPDDSKSERIPMNSMKGSDSSADSFPPINGRRGSTGSPTIPQMWLTKNTVGSPWTVQVSNLRCSQNSREVLSSLHSMENHIMNIDESDRMKLYKGPFEIAIKSLLLRKSLITDDVYREISHIMINYFNESSFRKLPECLISEIFLWIPSDEFLSIFSVSTEFRSLSSTDIVWKNFYLYKFQRNNPNTMPAATEGYKEMYRTRLEDPEIGDKVEVSWQGKFRLEAMEVYQGRAWWVAEIVDKHTAQGKYKIRYPGWDSRWDEWVARSRLRWAVDKNCSARIQPNDVVELWCFGSNVPGAWLEARIKKIRNGKFCVGKVLSTGSLWVERERLRPVKRLPRDLADLSVDSTDSALSVGMRSAYSYVLPLPERLNSCVVM